MRIGFKKGCEGAARGTGFEAGLDDEADGP